MDKNHIQLNSFIFSVLIGIIFLLTPLLFFANSSKYYIFRFENYGVYEEFNEFSIDDNTVDSQLESLMNHLSPLSTPLDLDFYSNEDILHLYDVKNILTLMYFLYAFSIISVFLIYKKRRRLVNLKLVRNYCLYYILVATITGILIYLYFDKFFTVSHEITFSNNYWLLDPKTSNLIKFFPQELFLEVFILVIISNLLLHISFIMLSNKINGKRKSK